MGCVLAQNQVKTPEKEGTITLEQPPQMNRLLEIKKSYNEKEARKVYRIQIYNGSLPEAEKVKKEFTQEYEGWNADISFETPNYKVRVGKFRTRLEADKQLLEVKKDYPSAFLLTPQER